MSLSSSEGASPAAIQAAVDGAVAAHRDTEGPLLEVLHAVSAELGWLPAEAVPVVARALNLSRADVHGVATFYSDFRTGPPAQHVVRLCRAEACQSVGARELAEETSRRLGVGFGETTPDGRIALEQVFCFGNCALGPAGEVDGRLLGRLDADGLERALDEVVR